VRILVAIYSPFEAWCIPDAEIAWLAQTFPQHTFVKAATDEEALARIADADVVFGARVRPDQLAAARSLRWVHSPAAGVGNMLFADMIAAPVVMTNSRGIASRTIAEHVIAVTLALLRNLPLAWRRQAEAQWAQNEFHAGAPLRTLGDCRVLIVGLGSIGQAVARLASAFGSEVVGIRRRPEAPADAVAAVRPPEALHEELPLSDVVVLAAPDTEATRHLMGARELALLRDGAVLVNVARGKLIDEAALAAELGRGRIRAALDVFAHEPLAADSALWASPHALITPHVSGYFAGYWRAAAAMFADNLRRFEAGEPLLNPVDKKAGY
jgi:phosphoglycerate dehydrogenase-like enzyme